MSPTVVPRATRSWFDPPLSPLGAYGAAAEPICVAAAFRDLARSGALRLPAPGSGRSMERFRDLAEIAAVDLSLGRLAEGHADALTIIEEAGEQAYPAIYGVWVAGPPFALLSSGAFSGTREFCSGAGTVERALVTAREGEATWLFEVDFASPDLKVIAGSWQTVGMADSASFSVNFDCARALRRIGPANFYESRPGFWWGSLNVAACWFGGSLGLARAAVASLSRDAQAEKLVLAAELDVAIRTMEVVISHAAAEVDSSPDEPATDREARALRVRHFVYAGCQAVLRTAAELGGTRGATRDIAQARRFADLPVYLRQHHPGPDLQRLGELLGRRGDN